MVLLGDSIEANKLKIFNMVYCINLTCNGWKPTFKIGICSKFVNKDEQVEQQYNINKPR